MAAEKERASPTLKLWFIELTPRISLADLITIIVLGVAMLAAYFELKSDVRSAMQHNTVQDKSIEELRSRHEADLVNLRTAQDAQRAEIKTELRDLGGKVDEILRYLRAGPSPRTR